MKLDEMRGRLEFEEQKLNNNLCGENVKQAKVHEQLNNSVRILEVGTSTVNSKGMALDRRIEEIEKMIGVRACVDETTGKSIY